MKPEFQHKELISRCKKGDRKAQFELYDLYVNAMYNTCFRMVGNKDDAEDIIQDAFIKAFTKLESFQFKSAFGAWLKRIVINQTINFLNKRQIPVIEFEKVQEKEIQVESSKVDFNIDLVKKGIKMLSEGYRQILQLYLLEGYDHQEISEIAGISVSTSKSQYHRAKKKLVSIINEESWKI